MTRLQKILLAIAISVVAAIVVVVLIGLRVAERVG